MNTEAICGASSISTTALLKPSGLIEARRTTTDVPGFLFYPVSQRKQVRPDPHRADNGQSVPGRLNRRAASWSGLVKRRLSERTSRFNVGCNTRNRATGYLASGNVRPGGDNGKSAGELNQSAPRCFPTPTRTNRQAARPVRAGQGVLRWSPERPCTVYRDTTVQGDSRRGSFQKAGVSYARMVSTNQNDRHQ
jgi:hypothetical protein